MATGASYCQTLCNGRCGMQYRLSSVLGSSVGEILVRGVWMHCMKCTVKVEGWNLHRVYKCMKLRSTAKNKLYFWTTLCQIYMLRNIISGKPVSVITTGIPALTVCIFSLAYTFVGTISRRYFLYTVQMVCCSTAVVCRVSAIIFV